MQNTGKLAGKTIFITGGSRGIGKAIALKAAKDKANLVIAAKTVDPNPKLAGTIHSAAEENRAIGGQCLPVQVDVRDEAQVQNAVDQAVEQFGGIDIVVNNASAISLTGTLDTTMKKYDLMNQINARGTFLVSKLCIPHLMKSKNPHVVNLSPPLSMKPIWFKNNLAYTMAKYGMSMCVLGMAGELKENNIAVNALWPRTAIWTAAVEMMAGDQSAKNCRTVDIVADAFYQIVTQDSKILTGNFFVDETLLREAGVTDFEQYAVEPGNPLIMDGFVDEELGSAGSMLGQDSFSKKDSSKVDKRDSTGSRDKSDVARIFKEAERTLQQSRELKIQDVFVFDVDGDKWFLDGINGKVGRGEPSSPPSCTMKMNTKDFIDLFMGNMTPTIAFMSGKVKIKGNMSSAVKLDKLLSRFQQQQKSEAA